MINILIIEDDITLCDGIALALKTDIITLQLPLFLST